MRKHLPTIVVAVVAVFALASGAAAAGRYIITSVHQIKPSVLKKFQGRLAYRDTKGVVANMCAFGTDTTGQCEIGSSDARCPGGAIATGGGLDGATSPPVEATIGYNQADGDGRGWHVIMVNNDQFSGATIKAVAVCLGTARGAIAARGSAPASVRTQIRQEVAAMRTRPR